MKHEPSVMGEPLRFLSVCSGIEAASVAWAPLGWEAVAFGEIDKAASRLLAHRYPDVPNLGDFTKIRPETLGRVDILCGGTPCQAFSVAGARRGLDDERGNLSLEFVRLAHELADGNELRNAVWENVPGVLTMADNAFGCFLAGLVGADSPFVPTERKPADGKSNRWWRWAAKERVHAPRWPKRGMVAGPKGRAAWGVKDAQYFGLAQRRERVLVVADFGTGADPAAVLFERVGVPWNPPARGEAREGASHATAPSLTASGRVVERTGESRGQDPVVAVAYAPEIARCDATREGSSQDYESTTMVVSATGSISHSLRAEGCDASEDGTGILAPVCFTAKDYGGDAAVDIAPTLRAGTHNTSHQNGGVTPAVAFSMMPMNSGKDFKARETEVAQPVMASGQTHGNQGGDVVVQTVALRGREGGGTAELGGSDATALRASSGGGDKPHVLAECRPINTMIGLRHNALGERTGLGIGDDGDPAFTLSKAHSHAVQYSSAVRRLTPKECERLQGFPDNYTRIPIRWYPTKKVTRTRPEDMWERGMAPANDVKHAGQDGWWLMAADGPRYKQLGNSWAVPKFRWLGFRIMNLMPQNTVSTPAPISRAKIVENNEKILSTNHNKPFTFTPTRKEADMFRIEITAGSPHELFEAIRALAPIAIDFTSAANLTVPTTIDADPAPAKAIEPEPAEPKQRRTRAKKDDQASAAPSVENAEKSAPTQIDIEEAIAEKEADPAVEQTASAQEPVATPSDTAPAADTTADEPFTMTRPELKDWLIRTYLVDCIPEQNDRPAAFKALCEENGFKNFTETPDDKLPALKALADAKIKQFKDGGK